MLEYIPGEYAHRPVPVDKAPSDFELPALKFNDNARNPEFRPLSPEKAGRNQYIQAGIYDSRKEDVLT
jgi:hypothetical protein